MNVDLFGNPIAEKNDLKSEFLIPPFSILDSASGDWQKRKLMWKDFNLRLKKKLRNKKKRIKK